MNKISNMRFIAVLSTLFLIVGCKKEDRTVEWYKAHEKERKEKIMKCNSEFKDTPDCSNAKEAESYLLNEDLKNRLQKKFSERNK